MERALPQIAAKLGVSLSVAPEFLNEVLVARWREVPGQAVLDSLAKNLGGEWVQTPEGRRLTRTSAIREALENEEKEQLRKALAKGLAGLLDPAPFDVPPGAELVPTAPPPEEEDENSKKMRELYGELEATRTAFSKAMWKSLSPEMLANIELEDRLVLSTKPTAGQRPFAQEVMAAFQTFQQKSNTILERIRKLTNADGDEMPEFAPFRPTTRVLLVIQRQAPVNWVMRTQFLNASNLADSSNQNEVSGFSEQAERIMMMGETTDKVEIPFKLNQPKKEIPVDESMKPLSIMLNAVMQGAPPPAMKGDMFSFFRKPDETDPLSLTATTVLITLAEDQKANLTAILPDELFVLESSTFMSRKLDLQTACETIEALKATKFEIRDGFMEMRPVYRLYGSRLDRKALRAAIDAEASHGALTIDQKAALAITHPDRSEMLFMIYQFLLLTSFSDGLIFGGSTMSVDNRFETLRFFHSLSGELRQRLLRGEAIPYRELTAEQKRRFALCVQYIMDVTAPEINFEDMVVPDSQPTEISEEAGRRSMSRPIADLSDQPTALPSGGFVRATVQTDTVVKPVTDGSTFMPGQIMTASTLAFYKMMLSRPEAQAFAGMMPKLDRLRLGERTTLRLDFNVLSGYGARGSASGARFMGDPSGVPESALPPDFLARMRQVMEAMERSEQAAPGPDGPATPPTGTTP